ncbi:hypothetical protein GCM10023188_12200 [Pontibacter saemangeumensis]|uniref:Chain length determinant protein n=1 Tax=Pontibacter saemangeumensis TaxID=1084525 RepID=A0ABP8LG09_9BACT
MQQLKEKNEGLVQNAQDEIDLLSVLRFFNRQLKKVINSIAYSLRAIASNLITVLLMVVIGITVGYGLFYVTKPYYTSSMTLILSDIRNEFIEDQLNKLSIMINEDNMEAISQNLDISEKAAKQIKGMSFYNLDQDRIAEDSVLTGSPFRIELMLYDNKLFDTLEPALSNYLENNRYFSKQKRIRQQQMLSMISKYKNDIESLDSVKTNVANPEGPVNGFVYGQPIDPSNLYRESINMYQEQIKLEAELEKLDNVEVVTGFVSRLRPTGPVLIKFLLIGGFIGFIVGLIVALRLEAGKRKKLSY